MIVYESYIPFRMCHMVKADMIHAGVFSHIVWRISGFTSIMKVSLHL